MIANEFPLQKNDVHYNAETKEVTLGRDKFDALIGFVRELVQRVESTEDARDIAGYRARRSEGLLQEFRKGAQSIHEYVEANSLSQLARQSEIPYATCYRIVKTGLPESKVEFGDFLKLIEVAEGGQPHAARMKPKAGKAQRNSRASLRTKAKLGRPA